MRMLKLKSLWVALAVVAGVPWNVLAQTPISQAVVSHVFPSEITDGSGNALPVDVSNLPLDFFDDFSWRSFLALNWPSRLGVRGEPDTGKAVGASGPRVWETWKTSWEVILPTGQPPSSWASLDGPTPCPSVGSTNSALTRVFGSFSRFADMNEAGFGDQGGPLVAQNRTYVRYETRVNRKEFDFIAEKRLFLRSAHLELQKPGVMPLRFPDGAVEVKASWKELASGEDGKRFYVVAGKVLNPETGECADKRMGLVGLHIVHKTALRPQWIWSSFEHVDNVPAPGETNPSFNDPNKPQVTDSEPPRLTSMNYKRDPDPVQVMRELPRHPPTLGNLGTAAMNARYHEALAGTVWENYELVATQWPTKTSDSSRNPPDDISGEPFPDPVFSNTSVGNSTMESYQQLATSCMNCHDMARGKKLDFVFFLDLHAFDDTFTGATPASLGVLTERLQALRAIEQFRRSRQQREKK